MPHSTQETNITNTCALYRALELSGKSWPVGFLAIQGRPRIRTIDAGDCVQLGAEIGKAKRRLKLADNAPVYSGYEAGRDGFWVHRMLEGLSIRNVIIDPASIEVERRKRKRKTDRLDVNKLVTRLVRHHHGEPRVWSTVSVPTPEQEDARRLHRERERLLSEKKQHTSRILGLLATQGPVPTTLRLAPCTRWDGSPLLPDLQAELDRE